MALKALEEQSACRADISTSAVCDLARITSAPRTWREEEMTRHPQACRHRVIAIIHVLLIASLAPARPQSQGPDITQRLHTATFHDDVE